MLKVSVSHKRFLFLAKSFVKQGIARSLVAATSIFQQFLHIWAVAALVQEVSGVLLQMLSKQEELNRVLWEALGQDLCMFSESKDPFYLEFLFPLG